MRRMAVALGILGLIGAVALPANAQKTVKLFGTTYNVAIFGRDQTYKKADGKQVKIVLTDASTYTQKAGLFFAEGGRVLAEALRADAEIETLVVAPDRLSPAETALAQQAAGRAHGVIELTPEVFDTLAFREEEQQGLAAVVRRRRESLPFEPLESVAVVPDGGGREVAAAQIMEEMLHVRGLDADSAVVSEPAGNFGHVGTSRGVGQPRGRHQRRPGHSVCCQAHPDNRATR